MIMEAIIYNLYECTVCGYIYDEEKGDEPDIPKGTKFLELPTNWDCPFCDAEQDEFYQI